MKPRAARKALAELIRDGSRVLGDLHAAADEADDGGLGGSVTTATLVFLDVAAQRAGTAPREALAALVDALAVLASDEGLRLGCARNSDEAAARARSLRDLLALAARAAAVASDPPAAWPGVE